MTAALGHQCCIFLLHSDRNQYRYPIEFRRTRCGQPRGSFLLLRKGFAMTEKAIRPRRLVQLDSETVKAIDRLAGAETISRAAWIRRLLVQSAQSAAEPAV
jgi:Ribbon-helix-helix protein, copG family